MSPAAPPVARVLARLGKVRKHPGGWMARCPEHEDREPSLSVSEGKDGRALLRCHAGCETGAIVTALGLSWDDLFEERAETVNARVPVSTVTPVTVEYVIRDRDGRPVATHVREDGRAGKRLWWQGGLGGRPVADLPLYGIHELPEDPDATVVVVEGEKAADSLRARGVPAVGTVTGASTAPSVDVLRDLAGRHVVLWPDADAPGRKHMAQLAERLRGIASTIRIATWPEAPAGGDAADYAGDPWKIVDASRMLGEVPPARLVVAANVTPRAVRWAWRDRIALGKLTILDGRPGLGKTTMANDLAARFTTARAMPDAFDPGLGPRAVIVITGEDGWEDTLVPRLIAAGADLSRVHFRGDLSIPDGLDELEADILAVAAVFVLVDPLVAFVPPRVNLYRDQDARTALKPLAAVAERTGAAVLGLRHVSKATGLPAQDRGTGSVAIGGAARSNLIAGPDPDVEGRFALASIKNNLGPKPPAIGYYLESVTVPVVDGVTSVSVVRWAGEVQLDADDLVGGERQGEATRFLEEILAEGPRPSAEIKAAAEARGLSWSGAVRRASDRLGVVKEPSAVGQPGAKWTWRLPSTRPLNSHNTHNSTDAQHAELSTELSVLSTSSNREDSDLWKAATEVLGDLRVDAHHDVHLRRCLDFRGHQTALLPDGTPAHHRAAGNVWVCEICEEAA